MAQKEDIVFCKIAIANGLVNEADAQKVLALCDKREREAGQRPPIGTVFSKYNLLKQTDVQKVYEAVRKRTGVAAGPASNRSGSGVRKRGAVGRRRGEPAEERPAKPIDPATLWMGIGGIVVFIAIVFTMLYIVFKPDKRKTDAAAVKEPEATAPAAPLAAKESPKKAAAPVKPSPSSEMPKETLLDVNQTLADARSLRSDDAPKALRILEAKKKELEGKNYVPPKDLVQLIKELQDAAKQAATTGAAETPAAPGAGDAASAAPTPAADAAPPGKADELPGDSNETKPPEDSK